MDYARHELSVTFRRLLAAMLGVTLLVAFWSDRSSAAASFAQLPTALAAPGSVQVMEGTPTNEPPPTSFISLLRRPWLAFYTAVGAPALNQGKLSEDEISQFRVAIFRLAAIFLLTGGALWWRGQFLIRRSRRT
jgi:hypothetical protein